MSRYLEVSRMINDIYMKYVAPEDIHVYSVDEVFMDVTAYLGSYKMTAHELTVTIIAASDGHHSNGRHRHKPLSLQGGDGHHG